MNVRTRDKSVKDPYLDWCAKHHEDLAKFPNSYVAINLHFGIVCADTDEIEFARKLDTLTLPLDQVFTTHTSNWL